MGVCACGFDESRNYEKYPTLATLGKGIRLISGRTDTPRKNWFFCPNCRNQSFGFDIGEGVFVCTNCAQKLTAEKFLQLKKDKPVSDPKRVADSTLICAGDHHTVVVTGDGRVSARGKNLDGQCKVSDWTGVTAVAAGGWHTLGLRKDGRVLATGSNDFKQCAVSGWTDVTAIAGGSWHSLGLRKDGRVLATGDNSYGQCNVSGWTDISAITVGVVFSAGLRKDGTVVVAGPLRDGEKRGCSGWRNITAIAAGNFHVLGLGADGRVVAAGRNKDKQCDVEKWSDIVAVSAEERCSFGLRADGTLVTTDNGEKNRFWSRQSNIRAIASGAEHTVALTGDGRLIAYGWNDHGQCNLEGIRIPDRKQGCVESEKPLATMQDLTAVLRKISGVK